MVFKSQQNPNKESRINDERLKEIVEHIISGAGSIDPMQVLLESSDMPNHVDNSVCELLESVLKAAFDGTAQRVALLEGREGSKILFLDENDNQIAQVITSEQALLGFKRLLEQLSWQVDRDNNSSDPLYYYDFGNNLKGAVSYSPSFKYQGLVITCIEIIRIPNPNYIQRYIHSDKA